MNMNLGILDMTKNQLEEMSAADGIQKIPLSKIRPDPNQPRKHFDESALQELADTISQTGVLQPIIVRESDDDTYMIIMGERRWRASSMAGLDSIPAIIKEIPEDQVRLCQLVENLSREDMSAIEESRAVADLAAAGASGGEIAKSLGKSRTWVSFRLAVARNIDWVQESGLAEKTDSPSIMASVLRLREENPDAVAKILRHDTITREMVANAHTSKKPDKKPKAKKSIPDRFKRDVESISSALGCKVQVKPQSKGAQIIIKANSLSELEGVLEYIKRTIPEPQQ